ncbi:heme-binding domain-containing protein [Paracrocinitomix mangrovi]|uniref:heme-binding domain-containing protein n=1 Tax=Paracrocinitomix mangrovi TaxID=2862509 RepID=UPI001C8EF443|nr:heme-binding domain-containing protein [Paracrocinitomix mangrovi]UKN00263.1 heme-binding domain-containing protein [Paracrocinitomix mangrovi]
MKKKILIGLLAVFVIIQFFRIDTSTKPVDPTQDFLNVTNAPENVSVIMQSACYDCHSDQTKYPWYSQIAPVSWWVKHHVDEGKEHLNFSVWASYPLKKADHKLEECIEEVEEGEMPLNSYTCMHSDANLSDEEKATLNDFFQSLRTGESEDEEHDHHEEH